MFAHLPFSFGGVLILQITNSHLHVCYNFCIFVYYILLLFFYFFCFFFASAFIVTLQFALSGALRKAPNSFSLLFCIFSFACQPIAMACHRHKRLVGNVRVCFCAYSLLYKCAHKDGNEEEAIFYEKKNNKRQILFPKNLQFILKYRTYYNLPRNCKELPLNMWVYPKSTAKWLMYCQSLKVE